MLGIFLICLVSRRSGKECKTCIERERERETFWSSFLFCYLNIQFGNRLLGIYSTAIFFFLYKCIYIAPSSWVEFSHRLDQFYSQYFLYYIYSLYIRRREKSRIFLCNRREKKSKSISLASLRHWLRREPPVVSVFLYCHAVPRILYDISSRKPFFHFSFFYMNITSRRIPTNHLL